jgi:uncharacterized protein (DUF697 family)
LARLAPLAVYGLVRDVRALADERSWVAVAGAPQLADALAKELTRGGDPAAARRTDRVDGAEALVHVLAGPPTADDERVLGEASRQGVPITCVLAGPELDRTVPFVLATDVVSVPAGSGFPVERIAGVLARQLDERGVRLAARVPVLRRPVCKELIESFARRNAMIGAAVFLGGADLPVLTLNQLRLVLLLGAAHGAELDGERLPEILGVVGGGFAMRALARKSLRSGRAPAWLVKGTLAYAATRAVGEGALAYFQARTRAGS